MPRTTFWLGLISWMKIFFSWTELTITRALPELDWVDWMVIIPVEGLGKTFSSLISCSGSSAPDEKIRSTANDRTVKGSGGLLHEKPSIKGVGGVDFSETYVGIGLLADPVRIVMFPKAVADFHRDRN